MKTLLSLGYAAGATLHRAVYDLGVLSRTQFETPVIGIGNVQCGGTGKTPTVCDLSRRFLSEGFSVGVVVSGYKKTGKTPMAVRSCGKAYPWPEVARDLGDEGAEILFELREYPNAWVIASRTKWKGVAWAQQVFQPDVILVDDALQHHPLQCQKMLIVATRPQDILHDTWLPKGRLREKRFPVEAPDQCWVWTQVTPPEVNAEAVCWQRRITDVMDWETGQRQPLETLRNKSMHCLTGIAQPQQFVKSCKDLGAEVGFVHSFPDHHSFTETEIKKIVGSVTFPADWVATLKDAVKLDANWFSPGKLWVLRCEVAWNESFFQAVWPWLTRELKEGVCAS